MPTLQFNQLELLVAATNAGKIPPGLVNPNHPRSGATPLNLTMYSLKTNLQLTNEHQLMVRFAGQKDTRLNNEFTTPNNDMREPEDSFQTFWSAVGQHGWVLGNRGLNQITGHVNHHGRLTDVHSAITGEHYTRDFPNVDIFPPRLSFPAVNTGAGGGRSDGGCGPVADPRRRVAARRDPRAEVRRELQLPARSGHPEQQRALSRRCSSSTIRR